MSCRAFTFAHSVTRFVHNLISRLKDVTHLPFNWQLQMVTQITKTQSEIKVPNYPTTNGRCPRVSGVSSDGRGPNPAASLLIRFSKNNGKVKRKKKESKATLPQFPVVLFLLSTLYSIRVYASLGQMPHRLISSSREKETKSTQCPL